MDARFVEEAYVFRKDEIIGKLSRTKIGAVFSFTNYGPDAPALSYTMPAAKEKYEIQGYNLHPFFAGLLPEGLRLHAIRQAIKTSEDDLFSLLLASGSDTIGDISLSYERTATPPRPSTVYSLQEISFEELFSTSILKNGPQDDFAVAGVQPKVSAAMISMPVRLKRKHRHYILKLTPKEFPHLIENEAFFMLMAADCGIKVASSALVTDKHLVKGLLVERFDRRYDKATDTIIKLHQEDACQILDRYPADKYRLSFREIIDGLSRWVSTPIVEVAKLLRLKAFSYLIGNGDLHAKNISVYDDPLTGHTSLTPAYDIVSTYLYGDTKMALMLEGRDDNLKRRDFISCGERFEVRATVVQRLIDEVLMKAQAWIPRFGEIGFNEKEVHSLQQLVLKRAKDLE